MGAEADSLNPGLAPANRSINCPANVSDVSPVRGMEMGLLMRFYLFFIPAGAAEAVPRAPAVLRASLYAN